MRQPQDTIEEQVMNLFREIADSLPPGAAKLEVKCRPEVKHLSVSLTPVCAKAAQIWVDVENGDPNIYAWIGQSTSAEMDCQTIEDLRPVCRAVIEGKLQEELWLVDSEITKCIGRLELDGKVNTFRYWGRFFPFRRKTKKHIVYEPYLST